MKRLYQIFATLTIATVSLSIAFPAFAQPGKLKANDRNTQINVRSQPTVNSTSHSYGIPGDWVEVIDSTKGDDGYFWFYVRFESSQVEGWIRGDFINLLEYSTQNP